LTAYGVSLRLPRAELVKQMIMRKNKNRTLKKYNFLIAQVLRPDLKKQVREGGN
jgi:hypothetical protein